MNLSLTLNTGTETAYALFLAISGILLIIVGATGFGQASIARRALNGVIGLVMFGYGFWIFFLSQPGDSIWVFYYVFIVPIALVVQAFQARKAAAKAAARPLPAPPGPRG